MREREREIERKKRERCKLILQLKGHPKIFIQWTLNLNKGFFSNLNVRRKNLNNCNGKKLNLNCDTRRQNIKTLTKDYHKVLHLRSHRSLRTHHIVYPWQRNLDFYTGTHWDSYILKPNENKTPTRKSYSIARVLYFNYINYYYRTANIAFCTSTSFKK